MFITPRVIGSSEEARDVTLELRSRLHSLRTQPPETQAPETPAPETPAPAAPPPTKPSPPSS